MLQQRNSKPPRNTNQNSQTIHNNHINRNSSYNQPKADNSRQTQQSVETNPNNHEGNQQTTPSPSTHKPSPNLQTITNPNHFTKESHKKTTHQTTNQVKLKLNNSTQKHKIKYVKYY